MSLQNKIKLEELKKRTQKLGLLRPLEEWESYAAREWFAGFVVAEEESRHRKNYKRRLSLAQLNDFKLLADFDWSWPTKIDKTAIQELMTLEFMREHDNLVFVGGNGTGKTMIAKNIAFAALEQGLDVLSVSASTLLSSLSRYESNGLLNRGLARYTKPHLLLIDELGQLSYGNKHADLLFSVINARYLKKSTIITTNTHFKQWNDLFPSATCVATLIDRLVHHSEIIEILGESYRLKESQERLTAKKKRRADKKKIHGEDKSA